MNVRWNGFVLAFFLLFSPLFFAGCEALPFEFEVPVETSTVIEKGTLLENVLGNFGFQELTTFDISQSQEFKNNNAQKDQVVTAKLTELVLKIESPEGQNFDFLDSIKFYVQADGLDKALIAQKTIPRNSATVAFELENVELAPYIKKDSISITTDVKGRRPSQDTKVKIQVKFKIGAKL